MYARAATAYRQVDLSSAPKAEILTRLFLRFHVDVAAARTAIANRDIKRKAAEIDHATRIVVELRAALDHTAAPELATRLDALYMFVQDQLSQANLQLKVAPLDAAAAVMTTLSDAFAQVRSAP